MTDKEYAEYLEKQRKINRCNREINRRNNEIRDLERRKQQYIDMRYKLNQAIPYLTTARDNTKTSKSALKSCYSSETANKKQKDFDNVSDQINNIINTLKANVLPAVSQKIDSINSSISSKNSEINMYTYIRNAI